jgi:radical SAM superfamily enzyme YgiQ (UPF0313 family)
LAVARVLLLNPPCSGRPKLRDFSCGESAKADYYWAPIDLLVLSGRLRRDHDVAVLDAVAEGLSPAVAAERAAASRPDVVFSLTAAVTLAGDDAFLAGLKARTGARVYGIGDVASFASPDMLARASAFDGAILNFGDPSMSALADGAIGRATSVVLRRGDGLDARPVRRQRPLRYATPLHEAFPWRLYRLPFSEWRGCATVATAIGCPYRCAFCASGRLPFQARPIPDVVEELRQVRGLGIEEVYVRDLTFGPTRERAMRVARAIAEARLGLRWSAECRADVLDEEVLGWMGRAGCDVILVGVESGSPDVRARLGKSVDDARLRRVLEVARDLGIRTCGHFVLGTPGETRAQIEATIRMAESLPLDYASYNLFAPRLGTAMRADLEREGRVATGDLRGQDVSTTANPYAAIDAATLGRLYRRAVLGFHLRPAQVVRLLRVTPWSTLLRQGASVVRLVAGMEG